MNPDPLQYHSALPASRHLAVAKRAGGLMIVLGVAVLLTGGCLFLGSTVPSSQFPPETQKNIQQLESEMHISMHTLILATGCVFGAIGLYQIIMGAFVRRGGTKTIAAAVIISSLIATVWTLQLIAALISGNTPNLAAGAGMFLITICLMAWQLSWLIQALHAARQMRGQTVPQIDGPTLSAGGQFLYPPLPPSPDSIGWPYPPPPPASRAHPEKA